MTEIKKIHPPFIIPPSKIQLQSKVVDIGHRQLIPRRQLEQWLDRQMDHLTI